MVSEGVRVKLPKMNSQLFSQRNERSGMISKSSILFSLVAELIDPVELDSMSILELILVTADANVYHYKRFNNLAHNQFKHNFSHNVRVHHPVIVKLLQISASFVAKYSRCYPLLGVSNTKYCNRY